VSVVAATQTLVLPDDVHNRALVANVHPSSWQNPIPAGKYNLVVLGAGTAGLVVIGGGPVGCELAQAFRRFGSEVTIVSDGPRLLPREDADAAAILERRGGAVGVPLGRGAWIRRAARRPGARAVLFQRDGKMDEALGEAILVAVGRAPNVEGLDLEKAGIAYDRSS
jgi:pyruvate/2-oxoglutarate dehydrogenase complex dihydrolipoamide dehydrogenase (E3) component